jgi:hypothetical protein
MLTVKDDLLPQEEKVDGKDVLLVCNADGTDKLHHSN